MRAYGSKIEAWDSEGTAKGPIKTGNRNHPDKTGRVGGIRRVGYLVRTLPYVKQGRHRRWTGRYPCWACFRELSI
jgi:hypothetical protein